MSNGSVGFAAALVAVQAGHRAAADAGVRVAVAVLDLSSVVVAAGMMDGTAPAGGILAERKARAALWFRAPTSLMSEAGAAAPHLAAAMATGLGDRAALVPGGVPIVAGADVIGAVGVGGASPDVDHRIAELVATRAAQ